MSESPREEVRIAREKRDGVASSLGVLVFLAGVAVIGWSFFQAYSIFVRDPQSNLGVPSGKPIDFSLVGVNFAGLIVRILVLVVIAGIGSVLANRGARMYASGTTIRTHETVIPPKD